MGFIPTSAGRQDLQETAYLRRSAAPGAIIGKYLLKGQLSCSIFVLFSAPEEQKIQFPEPNNPTNLWVPPADPDASDWFRLTGDVGLRRMNNRHDIYKIESLLATSGDLDVRETNGPMGLGLYTVDDATRRFQARNGLKADGWIAPDGPTLTKMRDLLGGLFAGHAVPDLEAIDQHHMQRRSGAPGLLVANSPNFCLKYPPLYPQPDDEMRGSNESWVRWLNDHQGNFGDAPIMLANYIQNFGDAGVLQARDFVQQWASSQPPESQQSAESSIIHAILNRLPDPTQKKTFLGGDLPKYPPIGALTPEGALYLTNAAAQSRDTPTETGEPPTATPEAPLDTAEAQSPNSPQLAEASQQQDTPRRAPFGEGPISQEFKDAIAKRESGGMRNPLTTYREIGEPGGKTQAVLGKYQLTDIALIEAGLKNPDRSWKPGNALGITSNEQFLTAPNAQQLQEKSFEHVMRSFDKQITNKELDQHLEQHIDGIKAQFDVTEAGIASATHRAGIRYIDQYFDRMKAANWDSNKALEGLDVEKSKWHKRVETSLREFSDMTYRQDLRK